MLINGLMVRPDALHLDVIQRWLYSCNDHPCFGYPSVLVSLRLRLPERDCTTGVSRSRAHAENCA